MMHDPLLRRDEQEQHEDSCQPPDTDWRAIDTSDVPKMTAAVMQKRLSDWRTLWCQQPPSSVTEEICDKHIARLRELLSEELPI